MSGAARHALHELHDNPVAHRHYPGRDEEAPRRPSGRARARREPRAGPGAGLAGLVPGYDKPGHQVPEDAELTVEERPRFVSRGGEKLATPSSSSTSSSTRRRGRRRRVDRRLHRLPAPARRRARDRRRRRLRPAPPEAACVSRVTVLERTKPANWPSVRSAPTCSSRCVIHQRADRAAAGATPPWPGWTRSCSSSRSSRPERTRSARRRRRGRDIHRRVLREVVDAALDWGGTTVGVVDSNCPDRGQPGILRPPDPVPTPCSSMTSTSASTVPSQQPRAVYRAAVITHGKPQAIGSRWRGSRTSPASRVSSWTAADESEKHGLRSRRRRAR